MSVIRIERAAVLTMVEGQAPIPGGVVQWDGREITYAGCAASAPDGSPPPPLPTGAMFGQKIACSRCPDP